MRIAARGLRDLAAVLEDWAKEQAAEWRKEAEAFRKVILDAVARSVARRKSSSRWRS